MNPADARLLRIVKLRVVITVLAKLLHALRRTHAQIIEPPEDDRFGWTDFRTGRHQPAFLAVVTKCALKSSAGAWQRFWPTIDHAKGTGDDAISAAVAHIVLHKDRADLGAHD